MEQVKLNLEIGYPCWIEYQKATYLGEENGLHKVSYVKKDEQIVKSVGYNPLPVDDYEPPMYLKKGNSYYKYTDVIYCWLRDGIPTLVYKYKQNSPRFSDECIYRKDIDNYEVVEDGHFSSPEDIDNDIWDIDKESKPLKDKIKELQNQVDEINKKKNSVYDKCFHDWELGEEEDTGRNFLGNGKKMECYCKICGKEQTSYYTQL